MKRFLDYIVESDKNYTFKIRVAGDLPEGFKDRLETNLKKYDLVDFQVGSETPIQESPLHFPQLQNTKVSNFIATVRYPVTPNVLHQYLSDNCSVHASHIRVSNDADPLELSTKDDTPYETLLTKEELSTDITSTEAQDHVGSNRTMDLLKELEKERATRENDPLGGVPKGESNDINDKVNTQAVVGG